jgi:hypothetical protein
VAGRAWSFAVLLERFLFAEFPEVLSGEKYAD